MNCDVLVLGGGSAGLAAAVAAARMGAHTVLVERHGMLGGMATAALVHSVCGLYLLPRGAAATPAHRGLPSEFADRLVRAGASPGPVRMGRVDVLPHSPPGFAAVADALAEECPNLTVRLHTELIAATSDRSHVSHLELCCRGRRESIAPRAVVDASGDGALATLAGLATEQAPADRLQRPAFIFALHGVESAAVQEDGRIRLAAQLGEAARAGRVDAGCLGAHFRGTGRGSEVYVTIDLAGEVPFDPTDPAQLARLELCGRRLAVRLTSFLRAEHAGFARAEIAAFPTRVGLRESRRVRGRATITGDDILRARAWPDAVAVSTWPMELRERHTGPRWRFPENDDPAQIPLGALHAADATNVWIAGRCLSCDHDAQAALRVIGTCLATGQAAGLAAAEQARTGHPPDAAVIQRQIEMLAAR